MTLFSICMTLTGVLMALTQVLGFLFTYLIRTLFFKDGPPIRSPIARQRLSNRKQYLVVLAGVVAALPLICLFRYTFQTQVCARPLLRVPALEPYCQLPFKWPPSPRKTTIYIESNQHKIIPASIDGLPLETKRLMEFPYRVSNHTQSMQHLGKDIQDLFALDNTALDFKQIRKLQMMRQGR